MRVELPPEPMHFVNREVEKARAFRAVEEWQGRSRPLVLSLSGPGGLGKTELAFLIARKLREDFSDVLSVDLDDFRAGGELDPGEVLAQLLLSLDVEPEALERQFKARCRQYWNVTSDRRLVVVVDNARYASEIVPLLPASGNSVVIVASHGPLYDLEDGAAVDLVLPPLEDPAAMELLELIVRDRRLATDPEAARTVVQMCDGLPAALHVAGRWVRSHPLRPLSRLIAQLRAELDENGVSSGVEDIWDTAYRALSSSAALLYRLLPHHPGSTFTPESATALLGLGPEACQDALEELVTAGLLDLRMMRPADDARMSLPGPLHAHARRRARDHDTHGETAEAQKRLLRWFVRQAQLADRFAAGKRLVVAGLFDPVPDAPDVPLEDPEGTEHRSVRTVRAERAARWLYAERHALFACVRLAHGRGLDAEVVALCEPVWTYAMDHPHASDVTELFRLGVTSALRSGNASWIARMRCQLARPLWESGKLVDAGRELDGAFAALDLLGDSVPENKLRASTIEFRGMLCSARGDWNAAAADFTSSREVHLAIDNAYGAMLQTYRLGEANAKLGDLDEAARLLTEAHDAAVAQHRARLSARTGFALGGVLRRLGRTDEARVLYERSLDGARQRGSGFDEARVLDALAELAGTEGAGAAAGEHRAAAEAIRRRNGLL
ncbi:tetratricopeptide repeat protein [Streptomyces sp. NBC_01005]|uniref:tetratricopeptide repeat protein n=1 Tax=unclassified Streptomyces TaxID=2593676 RepID=UPI0038698A68|nr:tetratricopeptide repeat protein [Streptomyces sp. NBC_01005]WTC93203.1 tetratricopeptide repeat protein [Streptomyces sp. NBC_01650]